MIQTINRFLLIAFVLVLLLPLAGFFLLPHKDISSSERRKLVSTPELPSSLKDIEKFTFKFTVFYNDHFGFRDELIYLHNKLKYSFNISPNSRHALIGKQDWLYSQTHQSRTLKNPSATELKLIANYYNDWNSWFESQQIPYILTFIPHKSEVHPEYLPYYWPQDNQPTFYDTILNQLSEQPKLDTVNAKQLLLDNKKEGVPLYFKNDHHWNMIGADIVQNGIAERIKRYLDIRPILTGPASFSWQAQGKPIYQQDAPFNKLIQYRDSLTTQLGLAGEQPELYPIPDWLNDKKFRIINPPPFETVRSFPQNGLKALVIRDSYSRALIPYFNQYFGEVMYLWRYHPSPETMSNMISSFQPDIVIEQSSQLALSPKNYFKNLKKKYAVTQSMIQGNYRPLYHWNFADKNNWKVQAGNRLHYDMGAITISSTISDAKGNKIPPTLSLPIPSEVIKASRGKTLKITIKAKTTTDKLGTFAVNYSNGHPQQRRWRQSPISQQYSNYSFHFAGSKNTDKMNRVFEILADTSGKGNDISIISIELSALHRD